MLVVVVLQFVLFLGCEYCQAQYSVVKKCHAFSGEDANSNLEEAIYVYKNCFEVNVANFRHRVASNTCQETTLQVRECDLNILRKIEDCNSQDEDYFPKNVFKVISEYSDYICSNAPSYKFPILLDYETCFPSMFNGLSCYDNFRFFNTSIILSKEEMCSDEKEISECLMAYINDTCPNDMIFPQIVRERFDLDQSPCSGRTMYMINFKICLIAVILLSVSEIK